MGWTISSERHDERPTYVASGAYRHLFTACPAIVPLARSAEKIVRCLALQTSMVR